MAGISLLSNTFFRATILFLVFNEMKAREVCDEFEYYYHKNDKHCFNNPNGEWNVSQIIRSWGFTAEEYNVYTEDGYQLLVIRAYSSITKKTPLVIAHGLNQDSVGMVLRNKKSIAHYLGTRGYDVWLVNFRGTENSRGHLTKSANDTNYWTFSFHELGFYDIPAVLDLVLEVTKEKPIYLGESMGSTASYVFGSKRPDVAKEKLKAIVSFAPIAYMKNIKSYLKYAAPIAPFLEPILMELLHGRFPKNRIQEYLCSYYPFQMYFCEIIKMIVFGDHFEQLDPLDLPLTMSRFSESVAIKVIAHFAQIITRERFEEKDFGKSGNLEKYGQKTPPLYDVSKIPVPVTLFTAPNDWLGTVDNAKLLYSKLNEKSKCGLYVVNNEHFSHVDFEEAKDIIPFIFEPSLKILDDLENGNCKH